MGVLRKNRRLTASDLLAWLGFESNKRRTFASWHDWLEWYMQAKLPTPTPRQQTTRGWHQKRRRKGRINYSKAIRRYLRSGGDPNKSFKDMARLGRRA